MVSSMLSFLFLYLYLTYRSRFLGIWTAAWALWSLRIGYVAFLQDFQSGRADFFSIIIGSAFGTLILLGAAKLGGQRVIKIWLPLIIFGIVFRGVASSIGYEYEGFLVYLLILGSSWIWAGLLFANSDKVIGHVRWIPAIFLIAMGFHIWANVIYQKYPDSSPWVLNTTLALQVGIAIGVLLVFNRQASIQLVKAHAALEKSLTMALSGFIPICANCKSVRDERNKWQHLESYISERTEAQFSHGICPNCKAELYPELAQP